MTASRQEKKILEDSLAKLMIDFIGKYEPRAVYVNTLDKKYFVDRMKELKGSGLAFDYGVITEYPLKEKNECRFCYWQGNELKSALVSVPDNCIEITDYIIYPIPVYNDLIRHIEGYGYLKNLSWDGKPLLVNKY